MSQAATKTPLHGAVEADALLIDVEVARRLRISPRTLAAWRSRGVGPAFVSLCGGLVRYPSASLDAWITANLRNDTIGAASDQAAASARPVSVRAGAPGGVVEPPSGAEFQPRRRDIAGGVPGVAADAPGASSPARSV